MEFEAALTNLKQGKSVTREAWGDVFITMQIPDEHSKMGLPYIYMTKKGVNFPCDLSCESIFAKDWIIVYKGKD